MAAQIRCGAIVWAEIADVNGIRKTRPAIVVTPDDRISTSDLLEVVAVTSTLISPIPNDHVLLPWHANGHPRTGLKRKCAAVCSWLSTITKDDIQNVIGYVTGDLLLVIASKLRARP